MEVPAGELAPSVQRVDGGGGTVQTFGSRAPSHRITTVPVVAPYLSELAFTPIPCPASP